MPECLVGESRETVQRMIFAVAFVQPEGSLVHVTVQMLPAGLVPYAVQAALEHSPHGLGRVDMDVVRADILPSAVVHVVVLIAAQARVAGVLVRVDLGPRLDVEGYLGVQSGLVGAVYRASRWTYRRVRASRAPLACRLCRDQRFSFLLARLFLFPPADVGLVNLDDAAQLSEVVTACFAESAQHEP